MGSPSTAVRIRLRFSSIINYLALMYRILIAIGFTVIVARSLSIVEFGLWGIILSLVATLSAPPSLWNYWLQRYVSRGYISAASAGSGLTSLYAVLITPLYVGLGYAICSGLNLSLNNIIIISMPLLILNLFNVFSTALSVALKPELIGYKGFIYETLRLLLALILVKGARLGLIGVLISLELALLLSTLYAFITLGKYVTLTPRLPRRIIKEWFRGFAVPLLNVVYGLASSAVRAVVSLISGSSVPVAYLNVGYSVYTPMISTARASTPALYSRMLRRVSSSDVTETLRIFLLVGTLLLTYFVVLSRTIASLYNPLYVSAWAVVTVIAIYGLIESLKAIFNAVITGSSRADVEGIKSFKEVVRSDLFKASLMSTLGLIISYSLGTVLAINLSGKYLLQALSFAVGLTLGSLAVLPWFLHRVVRITPFKIPLKEIYAAIISGSLIALYLMYSGIPELIIRSFWLDIPKLLPHVAISLIIYVASWYAFSPWFRLIARKSLRMILRSMYILE